MNRKSGLTLALVLTAALSVPYTSVAVAEETATQEMAQIVTHLNHRPSSGDKEKLREIKNSGTDAEKTIANALLNMEHQVGSKDKEKLRMVSKDRNVPENTRELATIVTNLNHNASSADKEKLREIGM